MSGERKTKLSEKTADRLYEMIAEGRSYKPGSKLPNENELSDLLQVSRTTLRESISFLVAQGVLEIRRGRGTFVCEKPLAGSVDLTSLADLHARVRARDLFEMRLIFEPAAVALACQRGTDEELRTIQRKAEKMKKVAIDGGNWPQADQEFHWAIIKASHNEYMRRLFPIINGAVDEIVQFSENQLFNLEAIKETAVRDNEMILDFMLQRDEVGARHAMSIHMKHLMNNLPAH